ncbi:MAG: hypothetical protein AYP45_10060 [Candidatus Brocadia carolinensis]|uniref:LamG-like jellyroll fold domain-containing protein n=1 Tax=Candidatus Brocadia carolinensis TaxID=1004156 RepID=A0A1V4ASX4_9BACT|nr:MAG: hypothetical protein AYP45_10060 [Candidatus Brocadia caroliniensis]
MTATLLVEGVIPKPEPGIFAQLNSPLGITTDLQGNVWIHTDRTSDHGVAIYDPNGSAKSYIPLGGFTDVAGVSYLATIRSNGNVLALGQNGLIRGIIPSTGQVQNWLNLPSLPVDTNNIYDIAQGRSWNFGGMILPAYSTYGDIAVFEHNNIADLFVTGISQAQTFPFVMRIRVNISTGTVAAKVVAASSASTAIFKLARGIAVNSQGIVATTLPYQGNPYPLPGTFDRAVSFSADFPESNVGIPEIQLDGAELWSCGMTTDSFGNFYVATGVKGTAIGSAGSGALVILTSDFKKITGMLTFTASLVDSRDVTISPKNDLAYMTIKNYNTVIYYPLPSQDTTPPTVTSTSPANGATNAAVSGNITATFSEAMDASTITTATFILNNGVIGTISYNSSTKTATFNPNTDLSYSTTYTAKITTGAKDSAGNAMASNYTWSFTTAPSSLNVTSFSINNSASSTSSRTVTLNNTTTGDPTEYMASESSAFTDATWQAYSMTPSFTLSAGNGAKTVYFMVRKGSAESTTVSDSILLSVTVPTPAPSPSPSPSPTPVGCTDAYETNDSFGTAYGPLTSGNNYTGKICSSTDTDYFRIEVARTGTITVNLSVPSNRDYDLRLYNSSQSRVASSEGGTGASEAINYYSSTTGTYYIRVYGYAGDYDESQTYTLSGTWPTTAPSSSNLQAYYPFNEGSGTVAGDSSGNGNHGRINGGAKWTTGRYGGGLRFDGTNDYVSIPRSNHNEVSVCAWFKKNANDKTRNDAIFGGYKNHSKVQLREGIDVRFPSNASNTLQFVLVTQDGSGVRTMRTAQWNLGNSVGRWHHLAGTYSKATGKQRLYVNGVLVNTQTHPAGNTIVPLTKYPDMRIGFSRVNAGYFKGVIDDARIYSRALTYREVRDVYNNP